MEINVCARNQINSIREKCKTIKPLLVIWCTAYNHEQYIKDTLEGFVMQKTNYPFIAIVHDDLSSDNTAIIIKEYAAKHPELIFPILEISNQYSKADGSLELVMKEACEATGAKYIAWCEGDDFWTDSQKLQKQVEFLERNTEYGLCYTKVTQLSNIITSNAQIWGGNAESLADLLLLNTIPTLTTVFLRNLYSEYLKDINPGSKNWKMGDYPFWLYVSTVSKIKFLHYNTGVYRVLENSASHSKDIRFLIKFRDSAEEIRAFFIERNREKLGTVVDNLITQLRINAINYKIRLLLRDFEIDEAFQIYLTNRKDLFLRNRIICLFTKYCPALVKFSVKIKRFLNIKIS